MSESLTDIDTALVEVRALQAAFRRLEDTLESLREGAFQGQTSDLPPCDVPVTDHRRQH